ECRPAARLPWSASGVSLDPSGVEHGAAPRLKDSLNTSPPASGRSQQARNSHLSDNTPESGEPAVKRVRKTATRTAKASKADTAAPDAPAPAAPTPPPPPPA